MAEKSVEPDASRRNVASSPTSETPAGKASRNVSLGEQPAPTPVISFLFDSMRIANTRKGNAELMEAGKVMKAIQDELDQDEQRTFKEMSDKCVVARNRSGQFLSRIRQDRHRFEQHLRAAGRLAQVHLRVLPESPKGVSSCLPISCVRRGE
jgi:hypothetical protein